MNDSQSSIEAGTRIEWFVRAARGETRVQLPAPRGRDESVAMREHLIRHGWEEVKSVQRIVDIDDPRFPALRKPNRSPQAPS